MCPPILRDSSEGYIAAVGAALYRLTPWALVAWAPGILLCGSACRGERSGTTSSTKPDDKTIENKGSDTLVDLELAWAKIVAVMITGACETWYTPPA